MLSFSRFFRVFWIPRFFPRFFAGVFQIFARVFFVSSDPAIQPIQPIQPIRSASVTIASLGPMTGESVTIASLGPMTDWSVTDQSFRDQCKSRASDQRVIK